MAVSIYNPRRKSFNSLNLSDAQDLPTVEILLLNILIELQVLTQQNADSSLEDVADVRSSIVSEI